MRHLPRIPVRTALRDRVFHERTIAWLVVAVISASALAGDIEAASRPWARADTHRSEDRSVKLDLISRLTVPPETVVLGSSRSRRAEPSRLQKLTGRTAFNAGVRGGTAADAWVLTRYLAACAPLAGKRRYIWFVDAGVATNGVPPELKADPRAVPYLEEGLGGPAAGKPDCSPRAAPDSIHRADGSYTAAYTRLLPEHARDLASEVRELVDSIRSQPVTQTGPPSAKRYVWFERTLAFMNAHGARPVIVFNPIHPAVLSALRARGFPTRRYSSAYLARLHHRFDFVVVDAEDIRTWGGSASGFWDPTHINFANMRTLLRYIVDRAGGALR